MSSAAPKRRAPRVHAPIAPERVSAFEAARTLGERLAAVVSDHQNAEALLRVARKNGAWGHERDILQEACARILRKGRGEDDGEEILPNEGGQVGYLKFFAYLKTTVANLARNHHRDSSYEVVGAIDENETRALPIGGFRAARQKAPSGIVEIAEAFSVFADEEKMSDRLEQLLRDIRDELAGFSPFEREVFRVLSEGLSQQEAAQRLGKSQPTVARAKLKIEEMALRVARDGRECLSLGTIEAYTLGGLSPDEAHGVAMHIRGRRAEGEPGCPRCRAAVRHRQRTFLGAIIPPHALLPVAGGLAAACQAVRGVIERIMPGGGAEPVGAVAGAGGAAVGGSVLSGAGGKVVAVVASAPLLVGGGIVIERAVPRPEPKERAAARESTSQPSVAGVVRTGAAASGTGASTPANRTTAPTKAKTTDVEKARAEFEPGPTASEPAPPPPPTPPHPASAEFEPGSSSSGSASASPSRSSGGGAPGAEFGP
jgi:RNA polymerase sigma factor (sigma-70 family)